jgi:hypothetical protein
MENPEKTGSTPSMSAVIRPLSVQTRLFPFLTLFGLHWTGALASTKPHE